MKNVVECPREFIAYFNALETTCGPRDLFYRTDNTPRSKFLTHALNILQGKTEAKK